MFFKTFPGRVKAAGEDDGLRAGEFEALVAVFGNKDFYGDIIVPGAFKDCLAQWAASGDQIPIYWSHRMDDPDFNLGHVVEAKETDEGLWVRGLLDLDDPPAGSRAPQVHRLMKGRRVTQFSFAYDVLPGGRKLVEEEDGDWYTELSRLWVHEVGPTPIGANRETELLGVKAALQGLDREVKAGRALSAKNESALREARDAIDSVLSSIEDGDGGKTARPGGAPSNVQEEKASGSPEAKTGTVDEEPPAAKSPPVPVEEPKSDLSASTLAATINLYAASYGTGGKE